MFIITNILTTDFTAMSNVMERRKALLRRKAAERKARETYSEKSARLERGKRNAAEKRAKETHELKSERLEKEKYVQLKGEPMRQLNRSRHS